MTAVVTIAERKARALQRRQDAIAAALDDLRVYAQDTGGRFLIFGSAATGNIRRDSDLDILVDFPPETEGRAKAQVEEICSRHGVPVDIETVSWSSAGFLERVGPHAVVLG